MGCRRAACASLRLGVGLPFLGVVLPAAGLSGTTATTIGSAGFFRENTGTMPSYVIVLDTKHDFHPRASFGLIA